MGEGGVAAAVPIASLESVQTIRRILQEVCTSVSSQRYSSLLRSEPNVYRHKLALASRSIRSGTFPLTDNSTDRISLLKERKRYSFSLAFINIWSLRD